MLQYSLIASISNENSSPNHYLITSLLHVHVGALAPRALFLFVTENILSPTCVVLKTYDVIYSVVYVLESNAYYCAIISRLVTNKKSRPAPLKVGQIHSYKSYTFTRLRYVLSLNVIEGWILSDCVQCTADALVI